MLTSLKALLLPGIAPASAKTGDAAVGEGVDFAAMMQDAAAPLSPASPSTATIPAAPMRNPDPALEDGMALPEEIAAEPADQMAMPLIQPAPPPALSTPRLDSPPDDEAPLTKQANAPLPSVSAHTKTAPAIHGGSHPLEDEAAIPAPDDGADDLPGEETSTGPDLLSATQPTLSAPSIVVAPVPASTDAAVTQQVEQSQPASIPAAPAIAAPPQRQEAAEGPQAALTPSPAMQFDASAAESPSPPVAAAQLAASGSKLPALTAVPDVAVPSSDGPEIPTRAAAPASAKAVDAPATPRRSMSEVMSLLQLARDQLHSRDTAAPAPVVGGKADTPPDRSGATPDPAAPPVIAAPSAMPQPVVQGGNALPTVNLSAALGAQFVDMGVSGQWIDGLARDIARFSVDGAQGRFQIDAGQLGPVQVDIRQSQDGAAVSLTVVSEGAEQVLRQESDRLRTDTSLSAVRITDVKIERGHVVTEAARSDSGNSAASQQQGQHPAWGQSSTQSHMQGRGQGRENFATGAKAQGEAAVLKSEQAGGNAADLPRARYA
ncbi:flagellar hook-length control protein FliK [Sphingobium amiense]|nr:flagellar hook-length control protein FliK [Sphingobium amiense]